MIDVLVNILIIHELFIQNIFFFLFQVILS